MAEYNIDSIVMPDGEAQEMTAIVMPNGDEYTFDGGVTPTGNIDITQAGVTDVTNYATATVPTADPWIGYSDTGFFTENNQRKWHTRPVVSFDERQVGWLDTDTTGNFLTYDAVPTGTTVTPTESAQTIGGARRMMEGAVTVNAIPSNYVGSGVARKSSSDLTASGATVTAPAGYYETAASKAVAAGTEGTPVATKGAVSNHAVTVTPSVTNQAGYIAGGTKTGTGVQVTAAELVSGSETKTENGTYDVTNLAQLVVDVQSGIGMQVATKTTTLGSASASISFSGLSGEPTSFAITTASDLATGASPWKTAAVTYDGTNLHGQIVTNTSNAQASHSTNFTMSYSNGTLTVTGSGTNFQANQYRLVYTYGGTSANLGTDDVQVGSGATSITFTGLTAEPDYFSLVFTSNFGTSSGYQRVMAVVYDGNSTYGVAMDSGAKALSSWSYTYNNGTLTVTSTGTNNGGYFHQPGNYHLTYGVGGTVEPVEIEVEPLSVTQNGTYTAPDGKAYSPVTVNVSGGGSTNVATTTWTNSSTSTVSHQFTGLSGTPKAAFLRCTAQLTRSSNQAYYYIADIVWDGTNARGNYHLRSNGSYNDVPSTGTAKYNVTVGTNSITFSSTATSRSSAPGSFYNGTYELTYIY